MDREILFRGKRLNNGEWVEGFYAKTKTGQAYILPESAYISFEYQTIAIGGFVEVDPSTVGQYTGLTDKNGKRIFHGDIVKTHSGLIGQVTFGSFYDDEIEVYAYGWYWSGRDKEGDFYYLGLGPEWNGHQVIGNIHDDPELIGGEDDG